jgi:alpha 1,2-mannosyltransferase
VIPEHYHWPDSNTTFVPNRRANATIVMLARNGDLSGVVKSLKQMEDRFNKRFRYPYVFLNEEPFTDEFKECVTRWISLHSTHSLAWRRRVTELTDATLEFGLIPSDHWHQPDWIDEEKASAAREQMAKNNVIYGGTSTTSVLPADWNATCPFLR